MGIKDALSKSRFWKLWPKTAKLTPVTREAASAILIASARWATWSLTDVNPEVLRKTGFAFTGFLLIPMAEDIQRSVGKKTPAIEIIRHDRRVSLPKALCQDQFTHP
jgi:hypothetical protein